MSHPWKRGRGVEKNNGSSASNNYIKYNLISFGSVFLLIVVLLIFARSFPTGRVILEIPEAYQAGEIITGNFSFSLAYGELIPADAVVRLGLNNQANERVLSDVLQAQQAEKTEGNYYVYNRLADGSGAGFGVVGVKTYLENETLIEEEGFGEQYLMNESVAFYLPLELFNISAENGKIYAYIIYNELELVTSEKEIFVLDKAQTPVDAYAIQTQDYGIATRAISLSACNSTLNEPNDVYQLTQNVNSSGTCFNIQANNVTIDCQSYTINYSQTANGWGVRIIGYNNTAVKNCRLVQETNASTGNYGVYAEKLVNISIFNNNITTYANNSYGVYFWDKVINGSIINNTIKTFGDRGYGIIFEQDIQNSSIINNTINTSAFRGYGTWLYNAVTNTTIVGNNYYTYGNISFAILNELQSNETDITNNTIVTNGPFGHGIYLYNQIYNTTISNMQILTGGANSTGVLAEASSNITLVQGSNISTSGGQSFGIDTRNSSNFTSYNNSILTRGGTAHAFVVIGVLNINLSNSVHYTAAPGSASIGMTSVNHSIIYSNIFNSTASADISPISITLVSNSVFLSNNVSSIGANGSLVQIIQDSDYNSFINNTLFTLSNNIFQFFVINSNYPENNNITNNKINWINNFSDIYFGDLAVNNTLLTDQIIRNYTFLDSIVIFKNTSYGEARFLRGLNGSGNNLSADIFFANNSIYINETIASGGLNRSANITLYGIGNRGFSTPVVIRNNVECNSTTSPRCYNFTALTADTVLFNISSAGNYSVNASGAGDTTFPLISFGVGTQVNSSNVSVNWVFMNVSVTEANEANITFRLYNSSTNINTTTFTTAQRRINVTNLANGVYTYNVSVVDTLNNRNTTETRSITIDTTFPLISFGVGTQPNSSNVSVNWVFMNVSVTEANEANITFRLYNSSSNVNTTTFTNGRRTLNVTGLADGVYTYNVSVVDTLNNRNTTETRTILLDTIKPLISFGVGTQVNSSNVSVNWVFMNVSVTEANEANITFRLYNSSTNVNTTTFTTAQRRINVTNLANGVYTYNVSVVDTLNNRNTTETRSINIDATRPLVTINAPSNTTYTVANQSFNITINENGTCNYTLSGGAVNVTMQNNGNRNFNATNSSIANAGYTFRAYCFDTLGNTNLTTSVNFAVAVPAASPSETPASSGGGGGTSTGNKPAAPVAQCEENWNCGTWSDCSSGTQARQCTDANNCGTSANKPAIAFSCQLSDFFIEKSPAAAEVEVKQDVPISFSITARDDSLLASPVAIGVEWKINGEKIKSEAGAGSIYSAISHSFSKDSIISVVVSNKYKSKEISWNIKPAIIECSEDWQCEWGKCSNGFIVAFNCVDKNNCGTSSQLPAKKQCDCQPDIVCEEWSVCTKEYSFTGLVRNELATGKQTRVCKDKAKCSSDKIEEQECTIPTNIKPAVIAESRRDEKGSYTAVIDAKTQNIKSIIRRSVKKGVKRTDIELLFNG